MTERRRALITGVTGQDGSYLAELLLAKGYEVHGLKRRSSSFNTQRVDHIYGDPREEEQSFFLHFGDLTDTSSLVRLIGAIQPDEIYNLAAQSHVKVSFETPEYTANADAVGTLRLLEAVRNAGLFSRTRFYQASTSELFGATASVPQSEDTPFHPRSPYGVSKLFAFWSVVNYREAYGLFGCNGILFNHESSRRGETFVSRKITRAVAAIETGRQRRLHLGNLDAVRDWGHARDYVEGMWLLMQYPEPLDLVFATGAGHTVRDFVTAAFRVVGKDIDWRGAGSDEIGVDAATGETLVSVDPTYFRPAEVDILIGDAERARQLLGWRPTVTFDALVTEMMEHDMRLARSGRVDNGP